jgi:adenylate cyclase
MIHVVVQNDSQELATIHDEGPLEIGRAGSDKAPRIVINDLHASRDHLRLEETGGGRLRVRNLSRGAPVIVNKITSIAPDESQVVPLPASFLIGTTTIRALLLDEPPPAPATAFPLDANRPEPPSIVGQADLSSPLRLTQWLTTLFDLQLAAMGTNQFYAATAKALVELIELDRGMVLVREGSEWSVMSNQTRDQRTARAFSKTVVQHVVEQRRMLFECAVEEGGMSSLQGIEAVVAAPFFDERNQVAGVVYGSRDRRADGRRYAIKPLEALLVQLMAGIVGSNTINLRHEIGAMLERSRFEQFCSAEVAAELQKNPQLLNGSEREVSVVFADVRDFTALSEKISASDLDEVLMGVMNQLTECILRCEGFIIDYYGDGVCAMWNAPLEQANHAEQACRAAMEIIEELPEINARWSKLAGRALDVGIGISTGRTWVGNAGSSQRLKFGPRGHAVNLASRIQGATKRFATRILISDETRKKLTRNFKSRRLGKTLLVGLPDPIDLFELQRAARDPATQRSNDTYDRALSLFESAHLAECQQVLESALEGPQSCADDGPLRCLHTLVQSLSLRGAPIYSPVFRFDQK